jgi:Na+/melibiose symporter-like transporter
VSIGPWLFLTIISAFGFENEAANQTPSAQIGIMLAFTIIPAILTFISALCIHYFPLSGQEWKEKKLEIQKVHVEKEKKYLDYLRDQQKN